ncbi:MAG: hypothetical protein IT294_00605 [Deltaproteobacteria bacterium]|nr:hypothetical protein [Deltaproteobacteria bacterium]
MDMLDLLGRCIGLERNAAEFYEILARRFAGDAELARLWSTMAGEEREHARKLATWRELIVAEPLEHRPRASGFEPDVVELERMLEESRAAAATADEEGAFALALALEGSEINTIYTTLLEASPIARFPDFQETMKRETAEHHGALLEAARRRCTSDRARLRMGLLAVRED